jgi:tight adherence protein C
MVVLLAILSFLFVMGVVLSGYFALTAESPVSERLRNLSPTPRPAETAKKRPEATSGPVRKLLLAIGKLGFGGNEQGLTQMLNVAGYRSPNSTVLFLGIRTVLSVVPAVFVLITLVSSGTMMPRAVLVSFIAGGAGHVLCNYFLRRRANVRMRTLIVSLPDALDLMVVSLEAGLGLNATIARVGEERSALNDPLGFEFAEVSRELREGRSREEALRGLGDRNGVDDLKSLAALIIQSDRLGASMAKTLRAHADVLRTKRRQRIEEEARKLPIKMLFPLAFFILPALFLVAVGPAFLRLKAFFTEMNG